MVSLFIRCTVRFGPSQLSCLGSSVGRALCLEYRVSWVRVFFLPSHLSLKTCIHKTSLLTVTNKLTHTCVYSSCPVLLYCSWSQLSNPNQRGLKGVCCSWHYTPGIEILEFNTKKKREKNMAIHYTIILRCIYYFFFFFFFTKIFHNQLASYYARVLHFSAFHYYRACIMGQRCHPFSFGHYVSSFKCLVHHEVI